MTTPTRLKALAASALVVSVFAAACSSPAASPTTAGTVGTQNQTSPSAAPSDPATSASTAPDNTVTPSAQDLWTKARTSALAAKSGHMKGFQSNSGQKLTIDLAGTTDGTNQQITMTGADAAGSTIRGTMTLLTVGGAYYVKGDQTFWTKQGGLTPAQFKMLNGKYIKAPAASGKAFGSFTLKMMLDAAFKVENLSTLENLTTKVEKTTHAGVPAYKITPKSSDGTTIIVTADDNAHLLQIATTYDNAPLQYEFSQWNAVPVVKAPPANQIVKQ